MLITAGREVGTRFMWRLTVVNGFVHHSDGCRFQTSDGSPRNIHRLRRYAVTLCRRARRIQQLSAQRPADGRIAAMGGNASDTGNKKGAIARAPNPLGLCRHTGVHCGLSLLRGLDQGLQHHVRPLRTRFHIACKHPAPMGCKWVFPARPNSPSSVAKNSTH